MAEPIISKSKFLWGSQCSKLLWYAFHRKEAIPSPDPGLLGRFSQGHAIGRRARTMFSGGVEIAPDTYDVYRVARASVMALASRRPLFEAGFVFRGAFARADVLMPFGRRGWDIIEVKGSHAVHPVHVDDLAMQWHVYAGAGLTIRRAFIMHCVPGVDPDTEPDPHRLLTMADVTTQVRALQPQIADRLAGLHEVIRSAACPDVRMGSQCQEPYDCPLRSVCRLPPVRECA